MASLDVQLDLNGDGWIDAAELDRADASKLVQLLTKAIRRYEGAFHAADFRNASELFSGLSRRKTAEIFKDFAPKNLLITMFISRLAETDAESLARILLQVERTGGSNVEKILLSIADETHRATVLKELRRFRQSS